MTLDVHSFETDRAFGESASSDPFWEAVYRLAIPLFDQLRTRSDDCRSQRLGIDDLVLRTDGTVVRVQKKARRGGDGSDIALEVVHEFDDGRKKLGWIEEQDPKEDFFAYGFPHLRLAYVFPRLSLLRAWRQNEVEWRTIARESMRVGLGDNSEAKSGPIIDLVGWIRSRNKTYWTHSIVVGAGRLIAAVADTMTIRLDDEPRIGGDAPLFNAGAVR